MKKIFSLLAVAVIAATVNAQTTATYTASGTNAALITGGTLNSGTVSYTFSKGAGTTAPTYYTASPAAARMYAKNTLTVTVPSTQVITKFEVVGATGGNYLDAAYTINGGTSAVAPKTGTVDYTIVPTVEGNVLVFTTGPAATSGNTRVVSFKVTYKPKVTMAVDDVNGIKASLVRNTFVSNDIIFGTSTKVSIYNTAGQVVKTADVTENSKLDVSALPKGTYIVTGFVNGQAVSQKIIKK